MKDKKSNGLQAFHEITNPPYETQVTVFPQLNWCQLLQMYLDNRSLTGISLSVYDGARTVIFLKLKNGPSNTRPILPNRNMSTIDLIQTFQGEAIVNSFKVFSEEENLLEIEIYGEIPENITGNFLTTKSITNA